MKAITLTETEREKFVNRLLSIENLIAAEKYLQVVHAMRVQVPELYKVEVIEYVLTDEGLMLWSKN